MKEQQQSSKKKLLLIAAGLGLLTTVAVMLIKGIPGKNMVALAPLERSDEYGSVKMPVTKSNTVGIASDMASNRGGYAQPYQPPSNNDALEVDDRVYQKTGYYQLVANDAAQYLQQLKEYILSIDGRVLSTNLNSNQRYQYGTLVAKVPVAKFEEATQRVTEGVDKVMSENVNAQDRTSQEVTLNNKLDSLEEEKLDKEIELEEATTTLAKKQIELDIKRLENQIQQVQTQQKTLSEKVDYSTLSVSVADSEAYFNPGSYKPSIKEQIRQAWESVSGILYIIVYVAIWFSVYSILWLPLIALVFLLKRKTKKNTNPPLE